MPEMPVRETVAGCFYVRFSPAPPHHRKKGEGERNKCNKNYVTDAACRRLGSFRRLRRRSQKESMGIYKNLQKIYSFLAICRCRKPPWLLGFLVFFNKNLQNLHIFLSITKNKNKKLYMEKFFKICRFCRFPAKSIKKRRIFGVFTSYSVVVFL